MHNFAKNQRRMKTGFFNVILPREEKSAVAILLYGHIGREDLGVSWEKTDKTEELKSVLG